MGEVINLHSGSRKLYFFHMFASWRDTSKSYGQLLMKLFRWLAVGRRKTGETFGNDPDQKYIFNIDEMLLYTCTNCVITTFGFKPSFFSPKITPG